MVCGSSRMLVVVIGILVRRGVDFSDSRFAFLPGLKEGRVLNGVSIVRLLALGAICSSLRFPHRNFFISGRHHITHQ